jgi:6-phosphogluconolactonase
MFKASFIKILLTILHLIYFTGLTMTNENSDKVTYFYVGTYTDGDGKGIYLYKLDTESGEVDLMGVTENIDNPSYLAIDKQNKYLYAANETANFGDSKNGTVSAFKILPETKELKFINKVSSGGAHPCYVAVSGDGKFVLAANYSCGSVSLLPVKNEGGLDDASDIVQHTGSSINEKRQTAPHAHSAYFGPLQKFVYAVDLGIDKVNIYKYDAENGMLFENEPAFFKAEPGSGPRHMVFHPNGKFAYLISELNNKITALRVDPMNGSLTKIEEYSALPKDFEKTSYCADIHIHPNGKFLYGSNRGDNSIVIFEIDEESGKLNLVGHESTQGDWPRNFTIDPSDNFILAANQKSNDVKIFKINSTTGKLIFTNQTIRVPSPACVKFLNE